MFRGIQWSALSTMFATMRSMFAMKVNEAVRARVGAGTYSVYGVYASARRSAGSTQQTGTVLTRSPLSEIASKPLEKR